MLQTISGLEVSVNDCKRGLGVQIMHAYERKHITWERAEFDFVIVIIKTTTSGATHVSQCI